MFREPSTTDVIIEIIKSLPEKERAVIAKSINEKKKPAKKGTSKDGNKKVKYVPLDNLLQKYKGKLPNGFKFDREEANTR
jgi:hypothetical protein